MAQIYKGGLLKSMDWNKGEIIVSCPCVVIIGPQWLHALDHAYFSPWTENKPWIWNKPPLWILANDFTVMVTYLSCQKVDQDVIKMSVS